MFIYAAHEYSAGSWEQRPVDPHLMSERLRQRNVLNLSVMSCELLVPASFPLAAVKGQRELKREQTDGTARRL